MSNLETLSQAVLPDLASQMYVDIAVNENGDVVIAHSVPLPKEEKLSWLEFDKEKGVVRLFSENGNQRELGIKIWPVMGKHLLKAKQAHVLCVQDKVITSAEDLPLLVQDVRGEC
jgi:hypothetical protein